MSSVLSLLLNSDITLYVVLYFIALSNFVINNFRFLKYPSKLVTFALIIILVALPAFRNEDSSSDTQNYIEYFLYPMNGYRGDTQEIELGYHSFIVFLNYLTNNWRVFITTTSLLATIPIMFVIRKCSSNIPFSLLLFLITGPVEIIYIFYFGVIRQSISVGLFYIVLYLLCVKYDIKNNKDLLIVLALSLIPFSFHHSIVLVIPFYLLLRYDIDNKKVIIITFFTFIIGFIGFSNLLQIIGTNADKSFYFDMSSMTRAVTLISLLPMNLLGLSVYFSTKGDFKNDLWLKLFLYCVWLQNLLFLNVANNLGRMLFPSFVSIIFLLPNYISYMGRKGLLKYVICTVAILYYSIKYFVIIVLYSEIPGWEGLYPYQPYFY